MAYGYKESEGGSGGGEDERELSDSSETREGMADKLREEEENEVSAGEM